MGTKDIVEEVDDYPVVVLDSDFDVIEARVESSNNDVDYACVNDMSDETLNPNIAAASGGVETNALGKNDDSGEKSGYEETNVNYDSCHLSTDNDEQYIASEEGESAEQSVESLEQEEEEAGGESDGFSNIDCDGDGLNYMEDDPEKEVKLQKLNRANAGIWFQHESNRSIQLKVGQLFQNVYHFREMLREYVIQEGIKIIRQKNEKARVTVVCKGEGCPWRLHASSTADGHTYKIKTYRNEHTCLKKSSFKEANYSWIAKKLHDKFVADPSKSRKSIARDLIDMYGITGLKPMKLYRARQKAKVLIQGDYRDQYAKTRSYGELVLNHNPGSIVKVTPYERYSIEAPIIFKRMFVMFGGVKKAFLNGCRPYIAVDGCFLKGPYGGMLLAAMALDGNNGVVPLAVCVVEAESKDSWLYFFTILRDAIGDGCNGIQWTIMSDRQKGLIDAVQHIFPNAYQRFCLFHIESNFKLKFRHADLKDLLRGARAACDLYSHKDYMQQIFFINPEAVEWLEKIPKHLWCRHAWIPISRVDHNANSVAESFNHWINDIRDLPILSLLEEYRLKVMKRFHSRYQRGCSWKGKLVPKAIKKVNAEWSHARKLDVFSCGHDQFQCKDGSLLRMINLRYKFCDCGKWGVSGIPCMHAIACIRMKNEEFEDYMDSAYTMETYFKVYNNIINPQPDLRVLPHPTVDIMKPPLLRRLSGRPKKVRRLHPSEKLGTQRSSAVKCSNCKTIGHNIRRCRAGPVRGNQDKMLLVWGL